MAEALTKILANGEKPKVVQNIEKAIFECKGTSYECTVTLPVVAKKIQERERKRKLKKTCLKKIEKTFVYENGDGRQVRKN